MEKDRCGEVASKMWGESDLNPVLRANNYTRSKPPKPRERDVAPRTFVFPSLRLSSSHIYRPSGVGELLIAPFVTQCSERQQGCLARLNSAAALAPTAGVVNHQRGVMFKFQTPPFQFFLIRRLRAYQAYSKSSDKAPCPLVFPAPELFEKATGSKMPQNGKSDPEPRGARLSIPTTNRKDLHFRPLLKAA
jgi:hypothetical protein